MATHLSSLIKNKPAWLTCEGEMDDVIIASLGRLVRNLPGQVFPGWSTAASRRAVVDALLPRLLARPGFKSAFHADMSELALEQRRMLLERKLITPCMAARQEGCHVIIPRRQDCSIMLNEEEHLVVHFFRQGQDLHNVLTDARRLAAALEKDIPFAHDPARGYLGSLPSEAGDGIQLSAVLHLPALVLANMMPQVTRALEKLHAGIAPFYGGMQEDTGNTFIVFSHPAPPGGTQEAFEKLERIVHVLVLREIQVRVRLHTTRPFDLADQVGRAFGSLCYSVKLSYREMLDSLSLLRLGSSCGLLRWEKDTDEVLAGLCSLAQELAPTQMACSHAADVPHELHPVIRGMLTKEVIAEASPEFSPNPSLNP